MYLKSLTLKGFKSFSEPTTIDFKPGITAIVGPNGSGKSNIVDAVVWVLGTQGPKNVRSSKMEDVIFAGSASLPALGRAEVSLTIDNSSGMLPVSFSEVTISRVLFRNGESQYLLNSVPCKLADITEILSDARIGRNQHIIVTQGNLDEVLNIKPSERRMIIEEAAGILKFRRRKEATERRLNDTNENIVQLKAAMREIKAQMIPLKKQADLASKHDELKKHLRELKTSKYLSQYLKTISKENELRQFREELTHIKQEITEKISILKNETDSMRNNLMVLSVKDRQNTMATFNGLAERAKGLIRVIEERKQLLETLYEDQLNTDLVMALEAEVAALETKLVELSDKEAELAIKDNESPEDNDLINLINITNQERQSCIKLLEEKQAELARLTNLTNSAEHTYQNALELYHKASSKAEALSHALDAFKLQNPLLKDSKYAGKILGNLLEAKPGYEGAVEAAFKDVLYSVVLQQDELEELIATIKRGDSSASVIPIIRDKWDEGFKVNIKSAKALSDCFSLKTSNELINDKIKSLVRNYFVIDGDIYEAIALIKQYRDVVIITLAGDIVSENKIIIGQKHDDLVNEQTVELFYQEAELKRVGLKKATDELQELKSQLDQTLKEIKKLEERINQLNKKLDELNLRRRNYQESLFKQKDLMLAGISAQKAMVTDRINQLKKRLDNFQDRKKAASLAREDFERKRGYLDNLSALAQQVATHAQNMVLKLSEDLKNEASFADHLRNKIAENEANLERLAGRLSEVISEQNSYEVALAEVVTNKNNLMESVASELNINLDQIDIQSQEARPQQDIDKEIQQVINELEKLGPVNPLAEGELHELEEKLRFLTEQIADVNKARHELMVLLKEIEENMIAEFNLAFEEIAREFSHFINVLFPKAQGLLRFIEQTEFSESGVELEIILTGSKVNKLSLLSGGERSLVALAFLFAVFKARPSPFYILDEVEPALDDLNLSRFISLLNEFKKTSQIIIVTHQKRTMLAADALWGVTMKEGSSSKVVSQALDNVLIN